MKPLMVAATTEATDDQLVMAAREGSDEAFEALFRRYRDRITAYARGIVSDHARAEDIVQDVFVSALRSLRSADREIAFKPWVYEIAKNACIDHLRRARRASEVSIDSDDFSPVDEGRLSASVASTDSTWSTREDLDTLKMAFNDLPEAQREVLVSRELEGLSYDKISSRTGLTRSAVESMLFRARRSLKVGFDDISTGERCHRMQAVMASLGEGDVGLRAERRLTRHLSDCAKCRREAIALGLDQLALGAPVRSRARAAISKVASFLPLPAFLRRRWIDGANAVGAAGQSGAAEQGASLVSKAAVVLAAAAIVGAGGAGVAHKTGSASHKSADQGGTTLQRTSGSPGVRPAPAVPAKGSTGGARKGDAAAAPKDRGNPTPGGGPGPGGKAATQAGSLLQGAGDTAGSAGGGPVGGTVKGVGGTVDHTLQGVGGTVDNTVKGVGGTAGGTVNGVGGTVDNTVKGLGPTVQGLGSTVDKTVQQPPQAPRLLP